MDLTFNSASQIARVQTEDWVSRTMYCPNCGQPDATRRASNSRISDFFCSACNEAFEVKCLPQPLRDKVEYGAYRTLITRSYSSNNPYMLL